MRRLIPRPLIEALRPLYHKSLALLAAAIYSHPSRHLFVIGVTGTNGKSTTVEMISRILEEAGKPTASASSIRFRVKGKERANELKMTMPGRFQVQKFLREAADAGCVYVVLEVTSEGIKQFRHKNIFFKIAVLTNVTPEHIESHGSFEAYRAAKAELFEAAPVHVLNADDASFRYFSQVPSKKRVAYTLKEFPEDLQLRLPGEFNRANALAALATARLLGIDDSVSKYALSKIASVPGRLEVVQAKPFGVIVDYAHTPDALKKAYAAITAPKLICVLGSAGGGRDIWKRPEMGKIAAEHCGFIILTNEDPYDEPSENIINDVEKGLFKASNMQARRLDYKKILDRREAIHHALSLARNGEVVIITGKGCEPWLMGKNGSKIAWDDRKVVREELAKLNKR